MSERACAYPLHEEYAADQPRTAEHRTCAGSMVLPEQAGRAPQLLTLFCLACGSVVPVGADVHGYAVDAARAEGWAPPTPGPLTPGALSAAARLALYLEGNGTEEARDLWDKAQGELTARDCVDAGALTALGLDMQRRVRQPDVPAAVHASAAEDRANTVQVYTARARAPKKRAKKLAAPSPPMICRCGHTAGAHTTDNEHCRSCSCKCYRQAKPEPAAKAC